MSAPQAELFPQAIPLEDIIWRHSPQILNRKQKTTENREFWSNDPPKAVILASGSVQRMQQLAFLEDGVTLPPDNSATRGDPIKTQEFLSKNVRNHDGASGGVVKIGYLEGVPVFGIPSQESPKNDSPVGEAALKRDYLMEQLKGDFVFVAVDTVDRVVVKKDGNNIKESWLGKPGNEARFRENVRKYGLVAAKRLYLMEYYYAHGAETVVENVNGIVVARPERNQSIEDEVVLRVPTDIQRETLKATAELVNTEAGGGGLTQRFIKDWKDEDLLKIGDEKTQERLKGEDATVIMWALFCQIRGLPWWRIRDNIDSLNGHQHRTYSPTVIYQAA